MTISPKSGILLALLTLAGPARAADTSASDFHCLVVATVMTSADNEQIHNAGLFMTLYYLGRLDGGGKDVDFKGGYKAEVAKIHPENMDSEAKSCGDLLASRGAALSEMGKEIAPPPDAAPPDKSVPAQPAPVAPAQPTP